MATIEEKAKAYDEALERAKKWRNAPNIDKIPTFGNRVIEEIFPELCESEDEKIRKELINFLRSPFVNNSICDWKIDPWVSWLEKQGQEPKKVSIWKHWKGGIAGNGEGKPIYLIKAGNTYNLSSCLSFECDYIELSDLDELMLEKQGEQKLPIEKLPSEMKSIGESLGFTTQKECDEYNQMVSELIMSDDDRGEQKPSDNDMVEALRTEYEKGRADAFSQMQKDWSEEDEKIKERLIRLCTQYMIPDGVAITCEKWLEFLKERHIWKPSDEQMNAFEQVYDWYNTNFAQSLTLNSLYNDLKKLKEE